MAHHRSRHRRPSALVPPPVRKGIATARSCRGFTLLEIAIALVIVALLLGGMLRGQTLVASARVRSLVSQQEGFRAAFHAFNDRFRAFPGDYASASTTLQCVAGAPCPNGNGNGVVETNAAPVVIAGAPSEVHEELLFWTHLASAGMVNGTFAMQPGAAVPDSGNCPTNPYGIHVHIAHDAQYADRNASVPRRLNLKTGAQVPATILAEVDRKIDDGNGLQGAFRYSTFQGNAILAPPAPSAAATPGRCVSDLGVWDLVTEATNCGGATLL